MARDIIAAKSFRTVVGTLDPAVSQPPGMYLLDTNDSSKFFSLFFFFNGEPEKAAFANEYLRRKFSLYSDTHQKGDLSKPAGYLRELLAGLLRDMSSAGLETSSEESFLAMLVKDGTIVLGRLNSCPVFFLRDRKFRTVFAPGRTGDQRLQVEAYALADGDRIFVCPENMVKRLTKLELRNIIAAESDLDLACSKISSLASRYEEITSPRMLLVSFARNHEINKAFLNKRNLGVFAGIAALIMMLVFWNDITDFFRYRMHFTLPTQFLKSNKDEGVKKKPLYQFDYVYDGLTVPYDLAVDSSGVFYVVDDKEQQVIRYDPVRDHVSFIGNGLNLIFPTGIEMAGDKLYVTDFSNTSNMLYIMSTSGEILNRVQNLSDPAAGQLRKPKSIAIDPDGKVWVADRGNNRLVEFDMLGKYLGKLEFKPQFKGPNGLAFSPTGDIFVSFKETNQIAKIDRSLQQSTFNVYQGEDSPASRIAFNQPAGLAVDSNGYMYIADRLNFRIIVTDPRGKIDAIIDRTKLPDFKDYMPFSLKIGPDGKYLYIVGSTHLSYDDICSVEKCKGKIWRMRI